MHHYTRVEGGDARTQEGDGIARGWIADPKVYLVYQCLNNDVHARGTVLAMEGRFYFLIGGFCR